MSTDIRVGDLIRVTNAGAVGDAADWALQGRVRNIRAGQVHIGGSFVWHDAKLYDFEVLDRPLPPISDELLEGATRAYRKAQGYQLPESPAPVFDRGVTAVINFVRQHDNKESK